MADRGALVLAGGRGERFWPWSRPERPKQLLPLARGGRTLLEATLDRALRLVAVLVLWRAGRAGSALAGAGVGRLIVTSLGPSVWAGAAVLLLARMGDGARWPIAGLRALALLAAYVPAVWLFGRGLGLRALLRASPEANERA